jgi:hypothetical protein|tara:strand:+ start:7649 stop:7855 length:207 start_codon:yes stop_codon:yes gene_type:complete
MTFPLFLLRLLVNLVNAGADARSKIIDSTYIKAPRSTFEEMCTPIRLKGARTAAEQDPSFYRHHQPHI